MLLELRVENYAILDNVAVELAPGLNLLTGETGAGKSILIDALGLLLGGKADPDVVRHGAEKATISAVFQAENAAVGEILAAHGLDPADELILRREIAVNGRGRVFVNNQPATVSVLRQLAPSLAIIHAQNETLHSFDAAARLQLLDAYAGSNLEPLEGAYARWKKAKERIAELERDEQDRLQRVDLWDFQKKEIDSAHLQPQEDERLEAEKRVLANAERIRSTAMAAYGLLYEEDASVAASLRMAMRHMEELARFDPRFEESVAMLDSARISAEDLGATLRDYVGGLTASPERLSEIEDRLELLDRLKRKYGKTLADVVACGEEVTHRLHELENKDELLKQLRADLADAAGVYVEAARGLSRKRVAEAKKLEKVVEQHVNDLAMKARFRIEVGGSDEEANWGPAGFDTVEYLISANPGEPLAPVEKIASGGELSRLMLSLKAAVTGGGTAASSATAKKHLLSSAGTLIFDEIDTGIGGRAAEAVGRKLKSLAESAQVICVTHLPQIASFADRHYLIEKKQSGGRTRTGIRVLTGSERAQELARMLSGATLTDASLKHAEEMLKMNA